MLIAAALAFQLALRRLHSGIEAALGPRAALQSVSLGWTGVELRGLRVRAVPDRWPAQEELTAERVSVVPALSGLWRGGWRLAGVTVEGANLPLLRTREGKLRLLPSLMEGEHSSAGKTAGERAATAVHIGELRLRDAVIDFHDASARSSGAPHRIRIEALHTDIGPLALPALDERRRKLDDPKFSLNELFAARFAVGPAEKHGVSLGGVVEGVGSAIKGLFGR